MKALLYHGEHDIRYDSMDDPVPASDGDIVVKTDACAICGSDLHIYHGHGYTPDLGFCVGHEAVGEVVEIGRAVRRHKVGDKVMLPAAVGCGACPSCLAGDMNRCTTGVVQCYGLGHSLQGCQAEAIRVPAGDFNAVPIPEGLSAEQALMLTDNLPTAWLACKTADIRAGASVAVVGLGPIGLMAVESAFVLGAARVFAIDPIAERRALAAQMGAIALDPADAVEKIREATRARMVESVIEAVGADATIQLAIRLAGRVGTISSIGVNQTRNFNFPMASFFGRGLTFRSGLCSVPEHLPELVPLVQGGRLRPERFISHRMPLSEGAEAYRLFAAREDGALKMVLQP